MSVPAFRAEYRGRELRADGSHLVELGDLNLQRFYGPAVPLEVLARNFAEGSRGGPFDTVGHRAAFDYDLAAALPKVTQPVLIVNPADDLALQTPRGLALLRDARLLELPGARARLHRLDHPRLRGCAARISRLSAGAICAPAAKKSPGSVPWPRGSEAASALPFAS
jgi:hypothetical protein